MTKFERKQQPSADAQFSWCGPADCGYPDEAYPDDRELRFPPPDGAEQQTCRNGRCDWTCGTRLHRHAHTRPRVYVPGAWEAEEEARIDRGETPNTTPPPRENR